MYSARAKRDVAIDKVGEPYAGKIKTVISQPEYGNMGNELLQSLAGYEASPEYPEATGYGEEVGQFDQKMTLSGIQHYENALTPKDKQLRKMIVDNLFDPQGNWRIPVDRLTRNVDELLMLLTAGWVCRSVLHPALGHPPKQKLRYEGIVAGF